MSKIEYLKMLYSVLALNNKGSAKTVNTMITLILVAILIPVGIQVYLDANVSGWDAIWVTIWNLIPLLAILGIGMTFIMGLKQYAGRKG